MAKAARLYRGSRGPERTSQRRVQLIEAGARLFGAAGYGPVSVRSVCLAAGLTERYFYESFKNREELLGAVYLDCVFRLQQQVGAATIGDGKRAARVRAGLDAWFGFIKREPHAARVVLFEVLGVSPAIDALYREAMAQFAQVMREQLGLGKDDLIASGLVGAGVHIAMQWVLSGYRQPQKAVVDSCVRIFLAVAEHGG